MGIEAAVVSVLLCLYFRTSEVCIALGFQHYAARNGHTLVCTKLISAGANVNSATRSGTTPLHRAAFCGHDAVVKLLLESGAQPGLCDADAQNALHKVESKFLFRHRLLLSRIRELSETNDTRVFTR